MASFSWLAQIAPTLSIKTRSSSTAVQSTTHWKEMVIIRPLVSLFCFFLSFLSREIFLPLLTCFLRSFRHLHLQCKWWMGIRQWQDGDAEMHWRYRLKFAFLNLSIISLGTCPFSCVSVDNSLCISVCGKPEKHPASAGRILGGKDANMGEIPWHLLIREPRRGGASLINDRWAVTAAHVVENVEETSLRLYGGLVNSRTISDRLSNVVVMDSERIIIHPNYIKGVAHRTSFDNDIALIRLASRVNLGPNLLPICLPEANRTLVENEQGTVSGFGVTEGRRGAFVTSAMLKYAHIGIYPRSACEDTPSTSTKKRMIFTNNMFCAGATGKDSCQKDSGGPFVLPMLAEGREPYYLTGIVSWGPPCSDRQYKGYYTKVENYVDWIKKTIDTTEKS